MNIETIKSGMIVDDGEFYILRDAETGETVERIPMGDGAPVNRCESHDVAALFGRWDTVEHDRDFIHVSRA